MHSDLLDCGDQGSIMSSDLLSTALPFEFSETAPTFSETLVSFQPLPSISENFDYCLPSPLPLKSKLINPNTYCLQRLRAMWDLYLQAVHSRRRTTFLVAVEEERIERFEVLGSFLVTSSHSNLVFDSRKPRRKVLIWWKLEMAVKEDHDLRLRQWLHYWSQFPTSRVLISSVCFLFHLLVRFCILHFDSLLSSSHCHADRFLPSSCHLPAISHFPVSILSSTPAWYYHQFHPSNLKTHS